MPRFGRFAGAGMVGGGVLGLGTVAGGGTLYNQGQEEMPVVGGIRQGSNWGQDILNWGKADYSPSSNYQDYVRGRIKTASEEEQALKFLDPESSVRKAYNLERELNSQDIMSQLQAQQKLAEPYLLTAKEQLEFGEKNQAQKAQYAMNLLNRQGELGAEQQIRGFEQDNVTNALKIGQRRDDRMAQMGMDTFGQLDNSGNQLLRNATDLMRNYNVSKWF